MGEMGGIEGGRERGWKAFISGREEGKYHNYSGNIWRGFKFGGLVV